jgi:hypothetical protein
MKFRTRQRRFIALLALLGLLFQQVVKATYACPLGQSGDPMSASSSPPCHQSGAADRVRCHTHCHPLQASSDHPPNPTVPAAILPPTTWLRAAARRSDSVHQNFRRDVIARATAPPLTIQHCTFQI